jgi:cell division protein FtsI (penicillin-binding protein 3)
MKPLALRLPTGLPGGRWIADRMWAIEHAFERARAEARPEEDTRVRIFFILAAFGCAFVLMAVGAGRAALFSGLSTGASPEPLASRADLVDRDGRLLASNLVHYGLYIDPDEVWDRAEARRALLTALPGLNPDKLDKALSGERAAGDPDKSRVRLAYLVGGLTPQDRARVHALALPGVSFAEEDKRVYPLGSVAAHLIGFTDSSGKGLAGIERAFDKEIRDAGPTGAPVPLSIDLRIQGAVEDELARAAQAQNAAGAVGVVTDARTGEILAMASWPSFDPNTPMAGDDSQRLDRAAHQLYEMGSTFKVFTLSAALDAGSASLQTPVDATTPLRFGARQIHDDHAQNRVMTLKDVFIHSSNIGTGRLALTLGRDSLIHYFDAYGLFRPAEVELAESAHPRVPHTWSDETVATVAFGQAISVTPLQVAAAMGAALNGGTYVPLTLRKLKPGELPAGRRVISTATSRAMLDLMRANVVEGTGGRADVPGFSVGGKTGTAQKWMDGHYEQHRLVASFASVFPTDGPMDAKRYIVLLLIDDPKGDAESSGLRTGGMVAAPVVERVINRIAPFLGVARTAGSAGPIKARPVVDEESEGEGRP